MRSMFLIRRAASTNQRIPDEDGDSVYPFLGIGSFSHLRRLACMYRAQTVAQWSVVRPSVREMSKWRLLRTLGISRCWVWPRIFARQVRPMSNRASSVSRRFSTSSHRRASRRELTFSSATSCSRTRKTSIWRDLT